MITHSNESTLGVFLRLVSGAWDISSGTRSKQVA